MQFSMFMYNWSQEQNPCSMGRTHLAQPMVFLKVSAHLKYVYNKGNFSLSDLTAIKELYIIILLGNYYINSSLIRTLYYFYVVQGFLLPCNYTSTFASSCQVAFATFNYLFFMTFIPWSRFMTTS